MEFDETGGVGGLAVRLEDLTGGGSILESAVAEGSVVVGQGYAGGLD